MSTEETKPVQTEGSPAETVAPTAPEVDGEVKAAEQTLAAAAAVEAKATEATAAENTDNAAATAGNEGTDKAPLTAKQQFAAAELIQDPEARAKAFEEAQRALREEESQRNDAGKPAPVPIRPQNIGAAPINPGLNTLQPKREKYCFFTKAGIKYIDYKDPDFLLQWVNEQGKIYPRRLTGTSLKHQRQLARAIKRARHLALLPFVGDQLK